MAEELNSNPGQLVSAPIVPSLPELESGIDPTQALHTPPPVITPLLPTGTPESARINDQLQGNFNTGPNPGARPFEVMKNGTADYISALSDSIKNDDDVTDPYKYGRAYAYGSGYKNMNFDRYYKHPKFKELGFSPYSNNETYYNEKSSWWDDFNRAKGEYMNLAWSGFKSVWGSEEDANEEMQKGMAIGTSSREGFGAWITNFGLNSAYTVGIASELAVENAALAAAEAATFGIATPEVGTLAYLRNSMGIGKLAKAVTGTADFIKGLKTAGSAKNFFTAAKLGEKAVDIAKWANPFERSLEFGTHLVKGTGGVQDLSNMAKVSKTFGNFYRDLRELNLAHSEAKLEGEGASTEYQNKAIDDFYAENGRMPEGQEARDIFDKAQSVKATVTLANDATIYLTNKLVLDDLLDGAVPGKALAKSYMEGSGRFFERTAAKDFQAGTTQAYKAGEATFGQKAKDFLIKSPYLPWTKSYMLGNLGEALQENLQEVISQSTLDYYEKIKKDPAQNGFYGALGSIGKSISGQFTPQGFDTFLQGYLTGALVQGGSGLVMQGGKRVFNRKAIEAEKETAEKTENDKYNAANFVLENSLIYGGHHADVASSLRALKEQKDQDVQEGDVKGAKDRQAEIQTNYFEKLARTNSMNLVTDHVDDLLSLENKDLENAFHNKESADVIREKLNTLKDRAESYQEDYDRVKRMKPNPYNPWMYSGRDRDGNLKYPEQYNSEMRRYLAHDKAVSDILSAKSMHADIAGRMEKIMNVLSGTGSLQNFYNKKTGQEMAAADLTVLIDPIQRGGKIADNTALIAVMKDGTPEQKKQAKALQREVDLYNEWNTFADTFITELRQASKPGAEAKPEGVDFAIKNLYKTYRNYIKFKTSQNKGYVFEDQLKEGFKHIKDFLDLSTDEMKAVNTINTLSDPDMFNRYTDILSNVFKIAKDNELRHLEEAFQKFEAMTKKNKMLKEIFGLGLFVLPDDIKLINDYEVTRFYNVADKSVLSTSDPKYKEAVEIVRKYGRAAGVDYADEVVSPDKHVIKRNADGTFSVIDPKGLQVEKPYKTREEAEKVVDKLNEILEKEKAKPAETPVTPSPKAEDIEAKKADIERRRQEELNFSKKDVTVKIETYEGIYKDTGDTHIVTVRTMEDGTKIIQEKVKGDKTPMPQERIKEDQLNLPIENFTTLDKGSLNKVGEETVTESKIKDKINAKYDAELAALEQPVEAPVIETAPEVKAPSPVAKEAEPIKIGKGFTINSPYATYTVERQIPNTDKYIVEVKMADGSYQKIQLAYPELLANYEKHKDYKKVEEEPDIVKNIMNQYAEIRNYDDLKDWDRNVLIIVGSDVDNEAVKRLHGVDLRTDVEKLKQAAYESIIENSKKIENLDPGLAVYLSDRTAMIVLENDGKTVTLVSPSDYSDLRKGAEVVPSKEAIENYTGPKVVLTEADLKDKIKMISGTPKEAAETVKTLTPQEIKDSDEAVKQAATDETAQIKEDAEKAKAKTSDERKKDILETINQCKKG